MVQYCDYPGGVIVAEVPHLPSVTLPGARVFYLLHCHLKSSFALVQSLDTRLRRDVSVVTLEALAVLLVRCIYLKPVSSCTSWSMTTHW